MKYITKKVIKNKTYYYLQYKRHNKNIGTIMPQDIKGEIRKFFKEIAEKEYDKLNPEIKMFFEHFNNLHNFTF